MTFEALSLSYPGHCPICEKATVFTASHAYFRSSLTCTTCEGGSVPRERALAAILAETAPKWRRLAIHESSPMKRGVSVKLARECRRYTPTQFFPEQPFGKERQGFRNENLEAQTFADRSFDIVISLDVMEHVLDPAAVYREVGRTLKPGDHYIHTFPIERSVVTALTPRVAAGADGKLTHLVPPEYHGNPVSSEGALVTQRYGFEFHKLIASWAPFRVRVIRACDPVAGILGDYTDVVVCTRLEAWPEGIAAHLQR